MGRDVGVKKSESRVEQPQRHIHQTSLRQPPEKALSWADEETERQQVSLTRWKQALRSHLVCLARYDEDGPVLSVRIAQLEGCLSWKCVISIICAAPSNARWKCRFDIPECVFAAVEVVFTKESEEVE